MYIVILAIRLMLSGFLIMAGLSKLVDRPGTESALRAFGLARWVSRPIVVMLPVVELAVSALLILPSTLYWGIRSAIALLLIFTAFIGVNVIRGTSAECKCFGQLYSEPIGWPAMIRNVILLGAAGIVLRAENYAASTAKENILLKTGSAAAETLLFALELAAGLLMMQIMRKNRQLRLRIAANEVGLRPIAPVSADNPPSGLPIGSLAPEFELPLAGGESTITLDALRARNLPVLLIFSNPACNPCTALLPVIARWDREHALRLTVAMVVRGSRELNQAKIEPYRLKYVLLQTEREIEKAYLSTTTPAAVVVSQDGRVASGVARGADEIAGVVNVVLRTASSISAI